MITAIQQTTFETMASEIARTRKIPRALAVEILVSTLGGGAEKITPNWVNRYTV